MAFDINLAGILKEYNPDDIKIFVKDFFMIFTILEKLDFDIDNQTDKNLEKFKNLIKDFARKYRDLVLEFRSDNVQCSVKIFILDDIENVTSLIKQMSRFIEIAYYKDKVEASFEDNEKVNSLTIKKVNDSKIHLIYLKEDMMNSKSPEFRLCTFYAMKNGFDNSVNLQKYMDVFSFDASDNESNKWSKQYGMIRFSGGKRF